MKARQPRPKPPACTCGASIGAGHQAACAFAQHVLRAMGARPARAAGSSDGLGRRSRHQVAKAKEVRGIRFRSGLEADVFEQLCQLKARTPGMEILRQPRFDLWTVWKPGMGKPLCHTPDFLVVRTRGVRALEPVEIGTDCVQAAVGTGWKEQDLTLFHVEVHEAKTAQGQEADDYAPRLAALRAAHPDWVFFMWRRKGKGQPPWCERLPDVAPAGGVDVPSR